MESSVARGCLCLFCDWWQKPGSRVSLPWLAGISSCGTPGLRSPLVVRPAQRVLHGLKTNSQVRPPGTGACFSCLAKERLRRVDHGINASGYLCIGGRFQASHSRGGMGGMLYEQFDKNGPQCLAGYPRSQRRNRGHAEKHGSPVYSSPNDGRGAII